MISSKNLADAIYKVSIDSKKSDEAIVESVLSYVKEYKLESILPKALTKLEDKIQKKLIWNTLFIKSGLEIDDSIVAKIKDKLKAEDVMQTTKETDKNLIGGFIATYKGIIYDASIKNKLQLLRNTLTK